MCIYLYFVKKLNIGNKKKIFFLLIILIDAVFLRYQIPLKIKLYYRSVFFFKFKNIFKLTFVSLIVLITNIYKTT